jgi:fumarate reductase flavoprotein subunit
MAAALRTDAPLPDPSPLALEEAEHRAFFPLTRRRADLEGARRKLYDIMWNDVGVLRTAEGLARARHALNNLAASVAAMGVPDPEPRYNLTWMDRLNLENLILTSRAICYSAQARTDSRGAHFREDHPEPAETARYTVVRAKEEGFVVTTEPVVFTRVRPGETLLPQAAE